MGRPIAAPLSFQYMIIFLLVNKKVAAMTQRVQSRSNGLELQGTLPIRLRIGQD